jgi:hypothetical protein
MSPAASLITGANVVADNGLRRASGSEPGPMSATAIDAYLVCGGRYHDIDYALLQLLALLGEQERIRTRIAEDYRDGLEFEFLSCFESQVPVDDHAV